jgi:[CysO sulfur-carrier protein]-S-L-cysteine hydrolase
MRSLPRPESNFWTGKPVSFGIVVYGYGRAVVEKQNNSQSGAAAFRPRAVEESPPAGLMIDRATYEEIEGHLRACLPAEGCGLLATRFDADGRPEHVERFYPGSNLDDSRTSYTMDPREVVAALKDMDARGWRLGAIVHSHPLTPATPSATDLRHAYYPGALMLIVSFARATSEWSAWRVALDDGSARLLGKTTVEVVAQSGT